METGAIIVAAGMSAGPGGFKPMLQVGSISAAKRIISTLQQSGAELIVVVTGDRADELEKHLAGAGIVFIRNRDYASTQMLDSVKIGLDYIKDKCDRVLFTPVDVPLFTSETISELRQSPGDIAIPTHGSQDGHPLLIKSRVIPAILAYQGDDGLRGALAAGGAEIKRIPVTDEGIIYDMDAPDDCDDLVRLHNRQLLRPIVSVQLAREDIFFGPEEASLLALIRETGSVKMACARMKMSYSKGWRTLQRISRGINSPAVSSLHGGRDGGVTFLTEAGISLMRKYTEFETACRQFAEKNFTDYLGR